MSGSTRFLRLSALIFQIICFITLLICAIMFFALAKKWFEVTLSNGALALLGFYGFVFYFIGFMLVVATIINGIFVLFDVKVVLKSDKKHNVLGVMQIIFGGIVGGILIILAGDGKYKN